MTPYHPMPAAPSCAAAWLAAARYLLDQGPVNTLLLHVQNPVDHSATDHQIIEELDRLLRDHGANPVVTVANTIFPQNLYRPGEPERLFQRYRAGFAMQKRITRDWGRYFDRMIKWEGSDGAEVNQLAQLLENLKRYGPLGSHPNTYRNIYELTLFHPEKDAAKLLGRQCLSFIEVKPQKTDDGAKLHMTALYRSHYYIARTLGNLVGLGRLLSFLAREAGYSPGTLTVHSTHAELDTGVSNADRGQRSWNKSKIVALVSCCERIMQTQVPCQEDHAATMTAEIGHNGPPFVI